MASIFLTTLINAPVETCFDLSRDVGVHLLSTAKTKERVVAGRSSGLCEQGDVITWEAIHFGIKQQLTVKILQLNFPFSFEDEMVKGAFAYMNHKHRFEPSGNGTKMTDEFIFKAPLGILGIIAEKVFLKRYMTQLLKERNNLIKKIAEEKSYI